ncbi:MAG: SET domain-containing protein [Hyphomonadaceae bacterium]
MTETVRRRYKPGEFDLAVKRSSAGLGLFAASPIPKGACVIEYTGRQISREEMYSSNSRYLFEINSRKTIDGAPRWNKARYINHSCRPNCEIEIAKGRVWIFARRNIKVGEELGYDYGEAYVNEYLAGKCLCAKCAPKTVAA